MTDSSPAQSQHPAYKWHEVWLWVMSQPSVRTFQAVLQDENASIKRAFSWVFVSGAIGSLIFLLLTMPLTTEFIAIAGFVIAIVGFTMVFIFVIGLRILQAIAMRLGGTGTYNDLYIVAAAYAAPLALSNFILIPFALNNPDVLTIYVFAYSIVQWTFTGIALKAVNPTLQWNRILVAIAVVIGIGLVASGVFSVFSTSVLTNIAT